MASPEHERLRKIPSVDVLMQAAEAQGLGTGVPRGVVVESVRAAAAAARELLHDDQAPPLDSDALRESILADVASRIQKTLEPFYCKVINATGIILHTGLGRAVLSRRAVRQIERELSGYSLLQVDQEAGRRSKRDGRIEELLRRLTGAEAATVVNNNAAATALVLNTVAAGREVIVSRGQLVEIGGSFRLPEVMAAAGVRLVEVGTTNKTHLRDYERAITENTAAILRVHPSNYKIMGFTSEVPLEDLVRLGKDRGLTVIDDVGAGALIDFSRFGFQKEPTLPESVATGADLITSSADKMIGGPQGGIILGTARWIQAIRKNPLARILRVDKLTLAALEATLLLFLDEALALEEVPTLRMLRRGLSEIEAQAGRIAAAIAAGTPGIKAEVVEGFSQMGSGSLPTQNLPTRLAAVEADGIESGEITRRLRSHRPPVFARVHDARVLIDPRTLLDGEEEILVAAVSAALQGKS
ncbi:MAG: L-seryl-tRNA(Sec) selenium transferase [Pirellulales bacterium]|nr:L-seryl-tRNA(Sec) selenium transferase [Pirellulales bacterium]